MMDILAALPDGGGGGGGGGQVTAPGPFGSITLPSEVAAKYGTDPAAIGQLLNIILNLLVVAGGVWALVNLITAGYLFMAAGDDSKKVAGAWTKIWQTLLGLAFVAGSFVLAAIFGQLIFNDPTFILKPRIQNVP